MQKRCQICGEDFEGGATARFCEHCKVVECCVCGKKFTPPAPRFSQYLKQGWLTCSNGCGAKRRNNPGAYERTPVRLRCARCGEYMPDGDSGKYCSFCRDVKCAVCGKQLDLDSKGFNLYLSQGFATCSKECSNKHREQTCIDAYGTRFSLQTDKAREKLRDYISEHKDEMTEHRKATCLDRYGREFIGQVDDVKERIAETTVERYGGVGFASEEIAERARDTHEKRYGVRYASQREEVLERRKQTNIDRHGYEYPLCNDRIREKAADSLEKRTGYRTPGCNDSAERVSEYVATCSEPPSIMQTAIALNKTYASIQQLNLEHNLGLKVRAKSSKEEQIAGFLDAIGVSYKRCDKTVIAPLEIDFLIEDYGVGIEVNDFESHNATYSRYFGSDPKPKDYHWRKTQMCAEKGVRLIHAWEHCLPESNIDAGRLGSWEVLKDIIEHALGITHERVYARNTRVVEFPSKELKPFFEANNINGYRPAWTAYCLVPKAVENPTPDDVLMAYAVGKAHFGKGKYDAEIARGACRLGLTVVGGASKLWSHIIEHTGYQSIVYYVDRNYYNADSMSFLEGVEYVGHSDSFWNYWAESDTLKNREPQRHAEIKRGYEDCSIWQIYNAGTDTYVWHRR